MRFLALLLLSLSVFSGCVALKSHPKIPEAGIYREEGVASWYGKRFHGRKTASGEHFNQHALTCAHRTLPFGTKLKVTNLENGHEVVVTVNDRGPFIYSRILDLSYAAAKLLNFVGQGRARVFVETVRKE